MSPTHSALQPVEGNYCYDHYYKKDLFFTTTTTAVATSTTASASLVHFVHNRRMDT